MAVKVVKIKSETTSLGVNVVLTSKYENYNVRVAEYLERDPLKNNKTAMSGGYLFRSPNITTEKWAAMLRTLYSIDGNFSIKAEMSVKKTDNKTPAPATDPVITAWIRFEDQSDAAMFAWSNVDYWQKWSDSEETAAREEAKRKPNELKLTKDGRLTGKVTITSLDK